MFMELDAYRYADLDVPGVSWDYMNNMAVTHAATLSSDLRFHLIAQSFIWDWICDDEVLLLPSCCLHHSEVNLLGPHPVWDVHLQ
jgi:hypothetical protein